MRSIEQLQGALADLDAAHQRRRRRVVASPAQPRLTADGKPLLSFCSNDYLGLANHPDVIEALCAGARQWGAGSGASHLVGGHLQPHAELEERIARFTGMAGAITFVTGYMANLAVTPALVGRGDAVFADRLNHASLIDAALASRAEHKRYAHLDTDMLEELLAESDARHKLILTDSVFSMDGDLAPLPRLFELAEQYDAWLVVDDAHGFGVLGRNGRGSLDHFGLPASPRVVLMGTFGKAAGVAGAFVAGDAIVMEWLVNTARSYIFTTAAPPALACALVKSLDLIEAGDERRAHLAALIARFRSGVADAAATYGWHLADSPTAIQPLVVGSNEATLALAADLEQQGLWVPAIRPPTVPKGSSRLRISLSAAHTLAEVDALLGALAGTGSGLGIGAPGVAISTATPPSAQPQSLPRPAALACETFGSGPQITLIHGWGLGSGVWAPVLDMLAQHFTVHRIELPGYGGSTPWPGAGVDDLADLLAASLPPRSMLVGWSLGALVALACAARHPRLVARLVLVGANGSFVRRDGWPEALDDAELEAFMTQLAASPEALLKRFSALVHAGDINARDNQRALRGYLAGGLPADQATLAQGLGQLKAADLRDAAFRVDQPTLLVHGAADPLMPLAGAERLARQLSGARLEIFNEAAHAPFASDPARFVRTVCEFAGVGG